MVKFKERLKTIYDDFYLGKDLLILYPHFIEEFFLIKANSKIFEEKGRLLSYDELINLKENFKNLINYCIMVLKEDHQIKIFNSLLTLFGIFKIIQHVDILDTSNPPFLSLFFDMNASNLNIIQNNIISPIYQLSFKIIISILTIVEKLNDNQLIEYFSTQNIFETLFSMIIDQTNYLDDIILILVLLFNYKKYMNPPNPYIMKLSIIDEQSSLNRYGSYVAVTLDTFNKNFSENKNRLNKNHANHSNEREQLENKSSGNWYYGLWNSLRISPTAYQSDLDARDISGEHSYRISNDESSSIALLAFYEAVYSNRSFITTLTHSHLDMDHDCHVVETHANPNNIPINTLNQSTNKHRIANNGSRDNLQINDDLAKVNNSYAKELIGGINSTQPKNLVTIFLEYTSIMFLNVKENFDRCKLCCLILTCLSEDHYSNSLMHDLNLNFTVNLHRKPLLHRRKLNQNGTLSPRPLICFLLDLLSEFLMCHLMKNFPHELYSICLGIVHRVLCYQKRAKCRLPYEWNQLWSALFTTLKFLISKQNFFRLCQNDSNNSEKLDDTGTIQYFYLPLINQIITIFNFFITFGDNFLPSPQIYDQLYYEMVRMHEIFDNTQNLLNKVLSDQDNTHKDLAFELSNSFVNINAIIIHFRSKINFVSDRNNIQSFSPEQVLEIIRCNYDSLTLKLHQNLYVYPKYNEENESAFMEKIVNTMLVLAKDANKKPLEIDYFQILKLLS
ncbi:unnamed protein product [Gordionus sp. m RMFG-2023]